MSNETRKQGHDGELRIDDLPPKSADENEQESAKGGSYTGGGGLFGGGILHETLPQMTPDQSGNEIVDGT